MIDDLYPAKDPARRAIGDALLTNRPESYPMGETASHKTMSIWVGSGTNLQSAGRELVKLFISAIVMNPDASSSNASKIGCSRVTSMNLIAHASGF